MECTVEKNKASGTIKKDINSKRQSTPMLDEDPSTEEQEMAQPPNTTSPTQPPPTTVVQTSESSKTQHKEKLYYRIGEAAKILEIEKHVIRYWEKEFEIDTHRSSAGQRMYRRTEIDVLRKIKSLIYDEGYTIQGAKKFLFPTKEPQTNQTESQVKQNAAFRELLRDIKRELQDVQSIVRGL
jgi:DNA-binding transcriptional MerR regulator